MFDTFCHEHLEYYSLRSLKYLLDSANLKIINLSPAQNLVIDTVYWMPFFDAESWTIIIGYWEVLIAILFMFKRTTFFAMVLLLLQMTGTFLPLIILPEVTFQNSNPFLPTLEGQYIIKNIIIITAALIIGGSKLKVNLFKKK